MQKCVNNIMKRMTYKQQLRLSKLGNLIKKYLAFLNSKSYINDVTESFDEIKRLEFNLSKIEIKLYSYWNER
jgi:hypothetical protein